MGEGNLEERGSAEASMTQAPAVHIGDGASCLTCGYSLAGLAREGVCPECARPVADSLIHRPYAMMDDADARWLYAGARRFSRALRAVLAAVPLILLAFAAESLVFLVLAGVALLVGWVYWLVGWCLVSSVRVSDAHEFALWLRRGAFGSAWAQVISTLLTAIAALADDWPWTSLVLAGSFLSTVSIGGAWLNYLWRRDARASGSPISEFGVIVVALAVALSAIAVVCGVMGFEEAAMLFSVPSGIFWLLSIIFLWIVASEVVNRLRGRGGVGDRLPRS